MKTLLFLAASIICVGQAVCQSFVLKYNVALPDTIQNAVAEWADVDNDGLLDVVVFATSTSDDAYMLFIAGDTVNAPVLALQTSRIPGNPSYVLVDYNHDNAIDILVSGYMNTMATTRVYLNQGNFKFAELTVPDLPPFTTIRFADLNNDAKDECILSGEENGNFYTRIFSKNPTNQWVVVHDSLRVKLTAIETIDFDIDGEPDLFISGRVSADSVFTGFLTNNRNFYFKPQLTYSLIGTSSVSDINNDGVYDVFFTGADKAGVPVNQIFRSDNTTYRIMPNAAGLMTTHQLGADFNSDGVADFALLGMNASNDTVNIIQTGSQTLALPHTNLRTQRFGDLEHDGDLDLLQVIRTGELAINFLENTVGAVNHAPGAPTDAIGIAVYTRFFMYWDRPLDDHTPSPSLTYDVFLQGNAISQVGEFDLLNEKRLTVTNGNNGMHNFKLLNLTSGSADFFIQAVDNAFHSGTICMGTGGGGGPCVDIIENAAIAACGGETLSFSSDSPALWFSFTEGYLGIHSTYSHAVSKTDTIFSFRPSDTGCAVLSTWIIREDNSILKIENFEKYACEESTLTFVADDGWEQIHWSSHLRGDLGNDPFISYTVSKPDTVILALNNPEGCTLVKKTAIKVSRPTVSVGASNYRVVTGESVHLTASGAEEYVWSPSTGLNRIDIPNPVATPGHNIKYTVTGYDSLGCEGEAFVSITVETSGFIPTLFTPNDDGTNDALKVYGLSSAANFSFLVYNREGSIVYNTSDVSQAMQKGWDGTVNGVKQPSGVYFWKVKGTIASGMRLVLNGKERGSVVLVR